MCDAHHRKRKEDDVARKRVPDVQDWPNEEERPHANHEHDQKRLASLPIQPVQRKQKENWEDIAEWMQVILQADEDLSEWPGRVALEFRRVVIRECTEREICAEKPSGEDRSAEDHGTEEERAPEMPRPLPECIEREDQEERHAVITCETREAEEDANREVPTRFFLGVHIRMKREEEEQCKR